jgi:multisubunit Na+/H+ antiporter MnhG subunit
MFVTMPVGSHMLGRAAHRKGEMTRVAEGGDALEWDVEKDQPDRVLP